MGLVGRVKKKQPKVLSICENSFKLVERMPRVCKAFIKAKGGYFDESKVYFVLLNTFFDSICVMITVLMSSLLFYNVENSKNKEKSLNE